MSKMLTDTECNKFLTLLMGECWHEWFLTNMSDMVCTKCKTIGNGTEDGIEPANKNHLSNPLPVIRWMEKEMPEVWGKYARYTFSVYAVARVGINKVLDLRNLVEWLWENQGWGEKECLHCYGFETHLPNGISCPMCHGTGKITHPALGYLREVKDDPA